MRSRRGRSQCETRNKCYEREPCETQRIQKCEVDLQFLDEVISDGADPNCSDRYGQTVLHEVSRAWSVDVMRFFLDRGSDHVCSDQFGVTALHVASALDYEDMVRFLLD
ncbi:hypothetical protein CRENBAI_003327 [Crenichthys baileyi]|uniref:Uncharacterized protein n=1 Tax=Crenichthys baileyi TaxID=28760 RepID=A0AAV9SLK4_9TELE